MSDSVDVRNFDSLMCDCQKSSRESRMMPWLGTYLQKLIDQNDKIIKLLSANVKPEECSLIWIKTNKDEYGRYSAWPTSDISLFKDKNGNVSEGKYQGDGFYYFPYKQPEFDASQIVEFMELK